MKKVLWKIANAFSKIRRKWRTLSRKKRYFIMFSAVWVTVIAGAIIVTQAVINSFNVENQNSTEELKNQDTQISETTTALETTCEETTTLETTQEVITEATTIAETSVAEDNNYESQNAESSTNSQLSIESVQEEQNNTAESATTQQYENTQTVTPNSEMPQSIIDGINELKLKYPTTEISIEISSLDGSQSFKYNPSAVLAAGCTTKAAYAMYVLKTCVAEGIDIDQYCLTYNACHYNSGSGTIKNSSVGTEYSVNELLERLLAVSDNVAYNILESEFNIEKFQIFLDSIGGTNLQGCKYGYTDVQSRTNEWLAIWKFVNSGEKYSVLLNTYLSGAQYAYMMEYMTESHTYLHKSGWSDSPVSHEYTCACDAGIIDSNYSVVILTQDKTTGIAHADLVKEIGSLIEQYQISNGGKIFN